jgi:hypothetical protein
VLKILKIFNTKRTVRVRVKGVRFEEIIFNQCQCQSQRIPMVFAAHQMQSGRCGGGPIAVRKMNFEKVNHAFRVQVGCEVGCSMLFALSVNETKSLVSAMLWSIVESDKVG